MEVWDAYNEKRRLVGKDIVRDEENFGEDEFHIVVEIWIINSKGEILLTQRSKDKKAWPLKWEGTAGSLLKGEYSYEAAAREMKEEIGIDIDYKELIYYKQKIDRKYHAIVDKWIVRKDVGISDLKFSDREVQDAKFVTKEEFKEMIDNGDIRDTFEYVYYEYDEILSLKQSISYEFLGKEVDVVFDRKMGDPHPKYPETIYEVNYGYVPGTISGDGEELDVYLIDSKIPLENAKCKCIGIIRRVNDDDDKLILVDINSDEIYTEEMVKEKVDFLEQYFSSIVIFENNGHKI